VPITLNTLQLTPQFFTDQGSQSVKATYGSFLPLMQMNNGMVDYIEVKVKLGCKNCTTTFMQAGLKYPNGAYANPNTSL
jgi:hypothetical protein